MGGHDETNASAAAKADPRELIAESYRMEGLGREECRSIFFDWAMGRSAGEGSPESVAALHAHYAPLHPDHPMTEVLAEGLAAGAAPRRRRGGRRRD